MTDLSPRRAGALVAALLSAVVLSACGDTADKPAAAQPATTPATPTKGKLIGTFQTATTQVSTTGRK